MRKFLSERRPALLGDMDTDDEPGIGDDVSEEVAAAIEDLLDQHPSAGYRR